MTDPSQAIIDEFWNWFQLREPQFGRLVRPEDSFWEIARQKLQSFHNDLSFELSDPCEAGREFVITAQGNSALFALVDAIVARAPKLRGWRFIALKPAMGFDFVTEYETIRFDPRSMWFLPLESSTRPDCLGLLIGIPNFRPEMKQATTNAVYVILDTALGERSASEDIQHVAVGPLPAHPEAEGYIHLHELPDFMSFHKRHFAPPK